MSFIGCSVVSWPGPIGPATVTWTQRPWLKNRRWLSRLGGTVAALMLWAPNPAGQPQLGTMSLGYPGSTRPGPYIPVMLT